MKNIVITACMMVVSSFSFSQTEKEIHSSIKKVTVYTQGAQIEREAEIALKNGQTVFKFTKLSPGVKAETIRINGDGSYTILNVQYQVDYLNELDKSRELVSLSDKIIEIEQKIEDEEIRIKINKEKLDFMNVNKSITGKDQAVSLETFKSMNTIYGEQIETLSLDILQRQRLIKNMQKEMQKINQQINNLNNNADQPSGTILVTLDVKESKTARINISYMVEEASWFPSYDIRFAGINQPLHLTHKANIHQHTGVDWENVQLILSTAKTNESAQIPSLSTHYLQFYYPQLYQALQGQVAGVSVENDELSESIIIRGIGRPNDSSPIYIVDGLPYENIESLSHNDIQSIEVLKNASATAIYGIRGANNVVVVTTKKNKEEKSSIPLTTNLKNETSNEYAIASHQTIVSGKKSNTINFKESTLEATFEYQAVPKLSGHVFLMGKINDWYKAELMDGEMNVYLENSYVGKSFINTQQFEDTLEISFGIDNNISIKREKLSQYSAHQFIGSNKKETLAFKFTLRNNKPYQVTTKITDQIPVSTTREIQVETIELSGGKVDKDTGKIEWPVTLNPGENKEWILKYEVKYPKDKKVRLD